VTKPRDFKSLNDPILIKLIQSGAVGVIPTDTVYGLVCQAIAQTSVDRLYKLKSREYKPGTVIASSIDQLTQLGIKGRYLKAVEQFWPGPVSILIPTGEELAYLRLNMPSLAVRIPKDSELISTLEQTGPLLTTSANLPGKTPATNIKEAHNYFGDSLDFYVDGSDLSDRKPSTLIRVIDDAIEILREGAVNLDEAGRIIE
jgi:L-threonylcarbamoyladenylate synthase